MNKYIHIHKLRHHLILFLIVFLLLAAGCSGSKTATSPEPEPPTLQPGQMRVCFLDVGQADSILIQLPNGENMLVDAGNNDDGATVVSYLRQNGVKQIDYLVGTHPHEDHIGGLDTVIKNFKIGKIYLPQITHTTRTFEDVLDAVRSKGLKITPAKAGVEIVNSGKLSIIMLAPIKEKYEDMNDYSAVIKVSFDQASFLLTGDAGEQSEAEMLLSSVISPKAQVLKVGHHGSRYSTSEGWLMAVAPEYAVISAGADNDYGHPHQETLQKLKDIKVLRTDLNGTIVFTTNGESINVTTEKNSPTTKPDTTITGDPAGLSQKVYVDANGRGLIKGNINSKGEKIYHLPGGANYDRTKAEEWFTTEEQALAAGFRPPKR